ncbi:hypothetical protein A5885_001578, partial [Enterococcus sp. 8E11_MSG4843]
FEAFFCFPQVLRLRTNAIV